MNTIWKFTIVTFKQRFIDYKDEKNYSDMLKEDVYNEVSSFAAARARKQEDNAIFFFSSDDLSTGTSVDLEFHHDVYSEMDPLLIQEPLFVEAKDEIYFILVDYWSIFLFFFFLIFGI
jgi:hypothetical protein